MEIYTIGFTKKSAEQFFSSLKRHHIKRVLDVRINNVSQLAGFTKRDDLAYFLREICDADYRHAVNLAPTKELLAEYRKKRLTWSQYEQQFLDLLSNRAVQGLLKPQDFDEATVLLCTEPTPEMCHRRLVVEYLSSAWGDVKPIHL